MSEMTLRHIWSLLGVVVVILCVALAVAGIGMGEVATAAEKRRWEPRAMACAAALYVLFGVYECVVGSLPWRSLIGLFLVVPAAALFAYLAAPPTKYCDKCNATQPPVSGPAPQRFCSFCGAELVGKPARDDRDLD